MENLETDTYDTYDLDTYDLPKSLQDSAGLHRTAGLKLNQSLGNSRHRTRKTLSEFDQTFKEELKRETPLRFVL